MSPVRSIFALLLLFDGEGFGELPEDSSLSVKVSTLSRAMGFFSLSRMT